MNIKKVVALGFVFLFVGCLTPGSKNKPKQNSSVKEEKVNTVSRTQEPAEQVDEIESSYKITLKSDLIIENNQEFRYNSDGISNNTLIFAFTDPIIQVTLKQEHQKWSSLIRVSSEWKIEYVNSTVKRYITTVDDSEATNVPFVIEMVNEKMKSIKWGNITYYKEPVTPPNRTNVKPSTTRASMYMDNHQVYVRKNEYLNLIIERYNKENNTNFTIQDVLDKNHYLKTRKNFTLKEGDILNF